MADHHQPPHDHLDDATLARYLSGTCRPDELARVERWLEADSANRAELARLQAAWNPPSMPDADPDDQMWAWIAARMDAPLPGPTLVREDEAAGEPSQERRVRRERRAWPASAPRWRAGLIAAAVALVVAGGLLVRLTPRPGDVGEAGGVGVPPAMRELATARGERATGNLPDGSRVILGPESRLRIPAGFAATPSARGGRDVYLEGEAFFEVTHDSTRPFRVHTANGIAEDLGTEFVVTAYPETRTTRVVVASGVVALRGAEAGAAAGAPPVQLTLEAGDLGRIDTSGLATLKRHVDVSAYVGWTKGDLAFDEVPLRDALAQFARWYDLDVRLADPALLERRLTATFHDEPVSRVLRVLEIALDVRAEQSGRQVTLRPVRAAGPRR